MEEHNQNGQLNNNQGVTTSGQGANFSTQNMGGNIVGNDTAGTGSGAVVSLKGGQTQKEIDEQKRIEELKSRAVKLERKLTPREKELEKLHKQAIKPVSPINKFQDTRNKAQNTNNVQNTKHNNQKNSDTVNSGINYKKQEELVENLINPTESFGKPQNTENFTQEDSQQKTQTRYKTQDTSKTQDTNHKIQASHEKQDTSGKTQTEKKQVEKSNLSQNKVLKKQAEKANRRMVISPAGQISYVDNQEPESSAIKKEEQVNVEKDAVKKSSAKVVSSSNIVNLKSEEESSIEQQVSSTITENKNSAKIPEVPKVPEIPWEEKKVDLKTLSTEKRIDMQATPSMASVNFDMDDDFNKEMVEWFDRYNELPINIKLGLGSSEVRQKIKDLALKNNTLNEKSLGEVSRIIRDVYSRLIKAEEIKKRLSTILKFNAETVKEVLSEIGSIVSEVKEVGNRKSAEYFEKLSLKDCIEKYPNIASEEITAGKISDKQTGKYIDPTIQNWMNDYISQMGSGQHTNLERGKYLNDSANTKNLSKEDKKIIEKLIKSYDEGDKLIIDREENVILWNLHEDESQLGINSDKSKRVINKFKIEEAQTADVDNENDKDENTKSAAKNVRKEQFQSKTLTQDRKKTKTKNITNNEKSSLENKAGNSIIKDKKKEPEEDDEVLNLSSEIAALR
jgi:hypothetical protein